MLYYRPVQYFTNHNRGVAPWSQGCVWEGVERRAGVEFLWTEILRAIAITIAESTANGAALVPTETRQSNHLAKMCHWKCECKARKAAELCVWGEDKSCSNINLSICLQQAVSGGGHMLKQTGNSNLAILLWLNKHIRAQDHMVNNSSGVQKISLIYGIHTSTLSFGTSKIRFKAIPTF